jgi:hypothetical protein
VLSNTVSDP